MTTYFYDHYDKKVAKNNQLTPHIVYHKLVTKPQQKSMGDSQNFFDTRYLNQRHGKIKQAFDLNRLLTAEGNTGPFADRLVEKKQLVLSTSLRETRSLAHNQGPFKDSVNYTGGRPEHIIKKQALTITSLEQSHGSMIQTNKKKLQLSKKNQKAVYFSEFKKSLSTLVQRINSAEKLTVIKQKELTNKRSLDQIKTMTISHGYFLWP